MKSMQLAGFHLFSHLEQFTAITLLTTFLSQRYHVYVNVALRDGVVAFRNFGCTAKSSNVHEDFT